MILLRSVQFFVYIENVAILFWEGYTCIQIILLMTLAALSCYGLDFFFKLDIAQKYAEPTWYSRTCNEMLHLWEKPWVHYFPQAQHIIYSSV